MWWDDCTAQHDKVGHYHLLLLLLLVFAGHS
jgi:hypothetical protein